MPLGLALSLIVLLSAGIISLVFYFCRKKAKLGLLLLIINLSVALALTIVYTILTFLFLDAVHDVDPTVLTTVSTSETTTITTTITTTEPSTTSAKSTPKTEPPAVSTESSVFVPPTETELALHPDVLGLRDLHYPDKPTFTKQNDVTKYVLHKFLNNCFDFEFYLTKSFYYEEQYGHDILYTACEAAMSYYLFSAYETIDMYVEDTADENKLVAKIKLRYIQPEYDQLARTAALNYLNDNPAPEGGFTDFESEKAYVKEIHDYIARRITFAPIGYDPESLMYLEHYEAYQEAYNALVAPDHTAVCAGYARGFALIAQYAGINVAYIYGNEDEISSHAWNMIYPCDGSEALLIDITWNDTFSEDVPGQEYVYDYYFYLPQDEDFEHFMADYYADFLEYINE